jgi:hypothetical protein
LGKPDRLLRVRVVAGLPHAKELLRTPATRAMRFAAEKSCSQKRLLWDGPISFQEEFPCAWDEAS